MSDQARIAALEEALADLLACAKLEATPHRWPVDLRLNLFEHCARLLKAKP